jgi:putative transposase
MSEVYYRCWYHIVWGTHCRKPFLTKEIRQIVFNYIRKKSIERGYLLDEINGIEDHVHCLYSLNPKFAVSKLVKDIKGSSSHWINTQGLCNDYFNWQDGYAVFSLSENDLKRIRLYIRNQERHHKEKSLRFELEGRFV